MQRWLKRAGLILFFGLWAAAGLQIWAKKQESREMEAVAAFSNIGTDNRSGIVQYYGKLKKRSRLFRYENVHLFLFAKKGFTQGCIEEAGKMGNVSLVTYDQIYEYLNDRGITAF
mgnify:CR=1 FL=1